MLFGVRETDHHMVIFSGKHMRYAPGCTILSSDCFAAQGFLLAEAPKRSGVESIFRVTISPSFTCGSCVRIERWEKETHYTPFQLTLPS